MSTRIAKLVLPVLIITAILGTHKLALDNGLFDLVAKTIASSRLPDSHSILRRTWTGNAKIDEIICIFISFFTPVLDGKHPTLTLLGMHFFGQLSSIWMLLLLESYRAGNAWKMISFITLWGLGVELIAMGIIVPTYCFLHLLTSPTAQSPKSTSLATKKTSLLVSPVALSVLPWSAFFGHFVPAFMGLYTDSRTTSPAMASQQMWLVARLFHPLFTTLLQLVLSALISFKPIVFRSATERDRYFLRHSQTMYNFAILVATFFHAGTVAMMVCSHVLAPLLSREYRQSFYITTVFKPVFFWEVPIPQVRSVGEGAFVFLQWDEIMSCTAILVWAMALNRQGTSGESNATGFFKFLIKTVLYTLVGGPAATAIALIRERDQVVLDQIDFNEDEKAKKQL